MKTAKKLIDYLLSPSPIGAIGPLELLVLQPTPFCNLDCDYCYLPNRSSTKRMKPEVLEATFEKVFQSGLVDRRFMVLWHAGEPLVVGTEYYKNAFAIIERLKPEGIEVTYSFQTNATLITDEWCELIKSKPFRVGVSIDGPAFINDKHRKLRNGAGTHHKVMEGIATLKKHDIPFSTIAVLTEQSLDHPDEMYNFFSEHDFFQVGFNVEEKEGANSSSTLEKGNIASKLSSFMSRFYDLNEAASRRLNVREFSRFEGAILGWSPFGSKVLGYEGIQDNAPFRILSVDWEGGFSTFSPELVGTEVPVHGKFTFGNVLTDRFQDTVKNQKFQEIARAIQRGIRKCESTCHYFSMCGGGSPANKLYENGSFDSAETMHCRLHVQAIAETVLTKLENRSASAL